MSNFGKLAHAVWECKYHLVWCPKYRYQVLVGDVGQSARTIIQEAAQLLVDFCPVLGHF